MVSNEWLESEIARLSKMLAELDDDGSDECARDLRDIISAYTDLLSRRRADEGAVTVEGYLPKSSPGNDYILLPGDARHADESLVPGSVLDLTIRGRP